MKKLTFESILLMSHRDRRGVKIRLDPGKNLIWGRNHTGKSSLIKTLYLTMGAKATGDLASWDQGTVSLVEFSIDSIRFMALHQNGARALLDGDGKLLSATANAYEWNQKLSGVLGFNLVFLGNDGAAASADVKCIFTPFYINQDGSWQSSWSTFESRRGNYCPVDDVLEYFSGIRPPEYYEAKCLKDSAQIKMDEIKRDREVIKRAKIRISEKFDFSGPKINHELFEAEIKSLTEHVTELNAKQEKLREKSVRGNELLASVKMQMDMANAALGGYEKDQKFLESGKLGGYACPVCNAEHDDPFWEMLSYAEDARTLKEVIIKLEKDVQEIYQEVKMAENEISSLDIEYLKISNILETRKGELRFGQVIESASSEYAYSIFESELKRIEEALQDLMISWRTHSDRMNDLSNSKRTKEILDQFRAAYQAAMVELAVPGEVGKRQSISKRPGLSGSGGPRSVLAYYYAIWNVCFGKYGAFKIPIVIDSPNQQGQDSDNLPKVIEFVSKNLTFDSQMILLAETEPPWEFDNKINLENQYRLMNEENYTEIESAVSPLVDQMYSELKRGKNLFGEWDLNS